MLSFIIVNHCLGGGTLGGGRLTSHDLNGETTTITKRTALWQMSSESTTRSNCEPGHFGEVVLEGLILEKHV